MLSDIKKYGINKLPESFLKVSETGRRAAPSAVGSNTGDVSAVACMGELWACWGGLGN